MTDLRKWSEDAFVLLAGLRHSVIWELAPEVVKEITRLVEEALATPASTARPDGWIDPENYVAWCRRSKNTIVTCDSDAPGAFKVYRLAAPGSVPQAPDSPNKPPCPNCGCNHFRGENTLCNDGVPQAEPPKEGE